MEFPIHPFLSLPETGTLRKIPQLSDNSSKILRSSQSKPFKSFLYTVSPAGFAHIGNPVTTTCNTFRGVSIGGGDQASTPPRSSAEQPGILTRILSCEE